MITPSCFLFLEVNVGEMSNKAVMEAKRWLEEKKSASNSKSKVSFGNSTLMSLFP